MPFAVSRHLALLAALGTAASPLAAQEKSLAERIADVLVQLNGGIHTGFRFMHAKGLVVTGTFTPAPSARGISEDFLAFLTAVAHTTPQSRHPNPVEQFLEAHPSALKFIQDAQPLPVSFATLAYFGNNAFVFVDSAGVKRAGRYRILPAAGVATLDSTSAAKAGPEYLFQDLKRRLARGAVRFRIVAQMAAPDDNTSDGSIVWPDDRNIVELGSLALKAVAPANEELQRTLTYNPIFLTPGIQLSDDPLVSLRSAVYALSVAHRH